MQTQFSLDPTFSTTLDAADRLAAYRDKFIIPKTQNGDQCMYLCGNSLGLQPKSAKEYVGEIMSQWGSLGVEGWHLPSPGWLEYHRSCNAMLAKIVGADESEVVAANSLTVNLHLLLVSFYRPTKQRFKILIEARAFPSDQYALKSQIKFHGFDPAQGLLEIGPRQGESTIRTEDILSLIQDQGDSIALVMLSGVNYLNGQLFEMRKITQAAKAKGCTVGFDLAHAAGNIPLELSKWEIDFAAWCNYKYLNSGPGAIGGLFVHKKHHKSDLPRFEGWWGNKLSSRFLMGPVYEPDHGAEGWVASTHPLMLLASLKAALELFDQAGMPALRAKSERLTSYLEYLLSERLGNSISILTPTNVAERGCQLSVLFKHQPKQVYERLIAAGVICDWREPGVIRFAPTPLYNSFSDVYRAADTISRVPK